MLFGTEKKNETPVFWQLAIPIVSWVSVLPVTGIGRRLSHFCLVCNVPMSKIRMLEKVSQSHNTFQQLIDIYV